MYYLQRHSKVLSILLCIMLVLTFTLSSIQEAQAFVPFLGFTAIEVAIAAGLLTAAGIEFATDADVRAAGAHFLQGMAETNRDLIRKASLAAGLLSLTPDLWAAVKGEANKIVSGEADGTTNTVIVDPNGTISRTNTTITNEYFDLTRPYGQIDVIAYSMASTYGAAISLPASMGSISTSRVITGSGTSGDPYVDHVQLRYLKPDLTWVTVQQWDNTTVMPNMHAILISDGTKLSITINDMLVWSINANRPFNGGIHDFSVSYHVGQFDLYQSDVFVDTISSDTYIVNNNYYGNPANDWGNREVTVPTTYPDVAGKTADNVLTDGGTLVNAPGTTTTTDNILTKILAAIAALTASLTGSASGSITDEFVGDGSGSINWEPLKMAGTLFTTKFPFSLPWDLLGAFQALGNPSSSAPVIPIDLDLAIFKWHTSLDFALFDPIVPTIRGLILIGFGISLIFGARKLLGGAT